MTPAEVVDYGRRAHTRATSPHYPPSVRQSHQAHADDLYEAIELYDELEDGSDAKAGAAEYVKELTGELITMFPACQKEGTAV